MKIMTCDSNDTERDNFVNKTMKIIIPEIFARSKILFSITAKRLKFWRTQSDDGFSIH